MIFELHNAAYLIILLVATNPARFTLAAIWRRVKVALVSWLAIAPSHAAGRKATVFSAIVGRANIGDWTFFIESYRGRDAVVDDLSFVISWKSKRQFYLLIDKGTVSQWRGVGARIMFYFVPASWRKTNEKYGYLQQLLFDMKKSRQCLLMCS